MAVTHSIAHMHTEPPMPPSKLLDFVNRHLAARYTYGSGTFVTAFYAIYDPATRTLTYASAGHPPARVNRCGQMRPLDGVGSLPLGIDENERYEDCEDRLQSGDALIIYTDGITEAKNRQGEFFGEHRLDAAACCQATADEMVGSILAELDRFRAGRPLADDRTLLVARVV
jgi:sigma-B regulation protein RsbU (phosphoserine phosphatase)